MYSLLYIKKDISFQCLFLYLLKCWLLSLTLKKNQTLMKLNLEKPFMILIENTKKEQYMKFFNAFNTYNLYETNLYLYE